MGKTTKWVIEQLLKLGIPIEYTFTDISISLVSAGKRKFTGLAVHGGGHVMLSHKDVRAKQMFSLISTSAGCIVCIERVPLASMRWEATTKP